MGDQNKELSRPIFCRNGSWDPFPNRTQPSRIYEQDFGAPPLLEPSDLSWMDCAQRRLASFSWPGDVRSPLLTAFNMSRLQRQPSGRASEIEMGHDTWKFNLDVHHFSPEEIAITTKQGYLEISGNHEERQDEHGTVSRSFTQKYKLPQDVDLQHIRSSLSGDGVLCVEAPIPGIITALQPAPEVVIPIQIRKN